MPATPTPAPDLDGLDGLDAAGVLAAVGEADLAERRAALATSPGSVTPTRSVSAKPWV